jgi:hypothetical protein
MINILKNVISLTSQVSSVKQLKGKIVCMEV